MVQASSADEAPSAFLDTPPGFFTAAYHFQFLPRVIAYRLGQYRRRERPSGFGGHVQLEIPLVIFACVLLMVFGLPPALQRGSLGGWISTVLGAGAFIALMGWSIYDEWRWRKEDGRRYGYADFMPSVFFFCVLAGFSTGLIAGGIFTNDPHLGYLWAPSGLVLGYLAGLFAGRWVHALGFIKTWFIYLAVLGLIVLPIEDLVALWVFAAKSNDGVWTGQ